MYKNEKIESLKKQAKAKKREAAILLKISKEKEAESEKILERAKKIAQAETLECPKDEAQKFIDIFKNKVNEKIEDKFRQNQFVIMSCYQIPKEIIEEYLCKRWDILGEYLDPEENSEPWKYTFTKPFFAQIGEYVQKEYVSIFEEDDL